jgi:hypothetical protein
MTRDWTKAPIPGSYAELYQYYGDPRESGFEAAYIVTQPHQVGGRMVNIQCHLAVQERLHLVFADLIAAGDIGLLETFDGSFVIRPVRGGRNPSLHSWGLAFDFNAAKNPLGAEPTMPAAVVATFHRHGFTWGGDFKNRKDGMHFQFTRPGTI